MMFPFGNVDRSKPGVPAEFGRNLAKSPGLDNLANDAA